MNRVVPTVLALILIALFTRLGFWQLDRADEKQALLDRFETGQQSTVDLTPEIADALPRYQRVRVRGRYDSAHQILLDNMPSPVSGWPGYRVVTPLELTQGSWVLVDRGWISGGADRAVTPEVAVDATSRTIEGRIDVLPRAGIRLEESASAPITWPRVLHFPDHALLERALERRLLPGLVVLAAAQPDGYERSAHGRAPIPFGPDRHIGYAVQWFALAVAVLAIYLVLTFRKKFRVATRDS